jgi:hypothetical protein
MRTHKRVIMASMRMSEVSRSEKGVMMHMGGETHELMRMCEGIKGRKRSAREEDRDCTLIFRGVTQRRKIMSRSPQVEDMEFRETGDYMTSNTLLHKWKTHSPPQMVTGLQMASTTPAGSRKVVGLAP